MNVSTSLETLFTKMENFVGSKTVVGDAITVGDVTIVPLVEVSFGVGAGSFDNSNDKGKNETGGGGLGASICPSAILVINKDNVQFINVKNQESVNKLIDLVPGILSKLNLSSLFKTKKANKGENDENTDGSDSAGSSDASGGYGTSSTGANTVSE